MITAAHFKTKAWIPYLTLGDPTIEASETLIRTCLDAGASLVEIGIPFSDPIADGPVIQASHQRALTKKPDISIQDGFSMVASLKKDYTQPLVFMAASNLIFRYGIERFFKDAKTSGLDGVIIPDLPVEESIAYHKHAKKRGISLVLLVSPLCDAARLKNIVTTTEGFLYLISTTGTTGARDTVSDLRAFVKKIKEIRDIPVCIGFGISSSAHIKDVHAYADGAIVGTYVVRCVEEYGVERIDSFKKAIKDLLV